MKISNQSHAGESIVTIRGEIDLYTAPQLHSELTDALSDGTHRLVVDMSRVEFCDSTGMSTLLSAMKRARENGGDLELAALTPAVRKVVDVTGLNAVFTIVDSVAERTGTAGSPTSA
ncbi:anti-sigma B factor antagonist [Haloactinospora alba]|uniref:Anti-sigma factor antagonist n=1 Tax=Haloactinospora alba TaxID=405555 RepID=A0A543NA00_9ACTN|nr:anti-sigma B factor antagonist [Haloactinospora alba]